MGRNDDKGPLFSGRFHRRNLAFERLLSVVEKETFIKEKKSLELSLKQNVYKNPNKCQSDFFMNNFFPKSRRKESRNSV